MKGIKKNKYLNSINNNLHNKERFFKPYGFCEKCYRKYHFSIALCPKCKTKLRLITKRGEHV